MQISFVNAASALIKSEVENRHEKLFSHINGLTNEFEKFLCDWSQRSERLLQQESPFTEHAENLANWQRQFEIEELSEPKLLIGDFQSFSRSAQTPFDAGFWQQQLIIENLSKKAEAQDRRITEMLLLNEWQKHLDKAQAAWQLEKLQLLRNELLAQIEEWLASLSSIQASLESLGLEPGIWLDLSQYALGQDSGIMHDLNHGILTSQDTEKFIRWAKYLSEDEGAKKICELLGKMRQISKSERLEKVKDSICINIPYVDVSSKQEIVGLKLGKDIEHTLPSELALLSAPDTAILFELKFLESRLLCFDMQGISFVQEQQDVEIEQAQAEDEKLGPMILCVDTSSSMQGEPEYIAKAMALFLASQAKSQARPCYLINFSTGIETYELTGIEGLSSLIGFLSKSFHGGTDLTPALSHALSIMKQESYKKADILVISDFIMGNLQTDILDSINCQRESGNVFNSLVIGDCFMTKRLQTHFDHEWIYNPSISRIHELVQFKQSIGECKEH
jgi:uncharacterized protein with von Willebrand factor type A (vWA) domain